MPAQIECSDLVKIYSGDGVEVQALQGLTFTVEQGELTAIVGASGSGKSTLLSILTGLETPTAGRAMVAGNDLLAMTARQRTHYRAKTVGFVWQQTSRNLLPYLTASLNIAMPLSIPGGSLRARTERVADLVDVLGIGEFRDRRPGELSGGQQQRVAIAVALANSPAVLFADEPTGELDEVNSQRVFDALGSVNRDLGVTVLIVTHDEDVSSQVRRTVQIRDGRLSTEVHRTTGVDEFGSERHESEEFVVIDRVGRLQLPQDYVRKLGLSGLVRVELADAHAEVHPNTPKDDNR